MLALAVALIAGFTFPASPAVMATGAFAVAAAAGLVALAPVDALVFRSGAVVAAAIGMVSVVSGGVDDAGVVQWGLVGTGALVAVVGPHPLLAGGRSSSSRWWVAGAIGVLSLVMVRIVVEGGPLGHDESALALKARSWIADTPDTGWSIHRGVGASAMAVPVLAVTDSEVVLRLVAVAAALATVAAVWWLGATVHSTGAGLAAAAVFAVAPSFLRRGTEFLTDVPSTGLLVVVTALVWRWGSDETSQGGRLIAASAIGAIAVYIRYQSILSLGLIALVGGALFWHRVRPAPRAVAAAAAAGVAILLPLLGWSVVETGTPWGLFVATGEAGRRAFLGEGIVDYVADAPYLLAGPLGAVAILIGLVWAVMAVIGGGRPRHVAVFLVVPAVAQMLILGTISHGEPRFVFFPVALMSVAAAVGVSSWRERLPGAVWTAGSVAFVAALVIGLGEAGARMDRNAEARGETFSMVEEAARVAATHSPRCAIMTGYQPQVTWFTGCPSYAYDVTDVAIPPEVAAGGALLMFDDGVRQPAGAVAEGYAARGDGDPIVVQDPIGSVGDATIYTVEG